jgi:hypothetical protein
VGNKRLEDITASEHEAQCAFLISCTDPDLPRRKWPHHVSWCPSALQESRSKASKHAGERTNSCSTTQREFVCRSGLPNPDANPVRSCRDRDLHDRSVFGRVITMVREVPDHVVLRACSDQPTILGEHKPAAMGAASASPRTFQSQ